MFLKHFTNPGLQETIVLPPTSCDHVLL